METSLRATEQERQKDASRTAILVAAKYCYTHRGIAATTIDDIARQANIGRATIYRHFKNHDDILSQLMHLEMSDFKNQLIEKAYPCEDAAAFIMTSIEFIVEKYPKQAMFKLFYADDAAPITNRLTMTSSILQQIQIDLLKPLFKELKRADQLRAGVTLPMMIDWLLRIVTSFVTMPSEFQQSPQQLRKYLRAFVIPSMIKEHN